MLNTSLFRYDTQIFFHNNFYSAKSEKDYIPTVKCIFVEVFE